MTRDQLAYAPIKISHKIDTKPNRQATKDTIYSTRIVDGKEKIVRVYDDIYDPKFKQLTEDIINGNAETKYIMATKDPMSFAEISRIVLNHYETFKDDPEQYVGTKKNVKLIGKNPLTAYKEEFGKIRKFSKKGNGPEITSVKYYGTDVGIHVDISKNYNLKHANKVILLGIKSYRTDFYRDKDGKIKMISIRHKDVSFKESLGLYCINRDWYQSEKINKNISDEAVFLCSLHHGELVGIAKEPGEKYAYDDSTDSSGNPRYHDGKTLEIVKFIATNDDVANRIEVRPFYTKNKDQIKVSVKSLLDVRKYATDVLGNMYEVKDNNLKLEFK